MPRQTRPALTIWLGAIASARHCMERLKLQLAVLGEECPELAREAEEAARLLSESAAGLGRLQGAAKMDTGASRN